MVERHQEIDRPMVRSYNIITSSLEYVQLLVIMESTRHCHREVALGLSRLA
jgi:hypothetical protein